MQVGTITFSDANSYSIIISYLVKESASGRLEKWAKEHHFMDVNGDINLRKAMSYAKKHDEKKRVKEITLARTLKRMRKKKGE